MVQPPGEPTEPVQIAGAAPPVVGGAIPTPTGPSGLAIASLICGILSVCTFCFWCASVPLGVGGLVCGLVDKRPSGLRTAGLICSGIGVLIGLVMLALGLLGAAFGPRH